MQLRNRRVLDTNSNLNENDTMEHSNEKISVTTTTSTATSSSSSSTSTHSKTSSKLSIFSCLGATFVLLQITCEVIKQISNYSLQYVNGGKYPVPQTALVVSMETLKFVATIVRLKGIIPNISTDSVKKSLRFLVPSVLYAANNNIYFIGLTLVPPPIWLILCAMRTVITASIYKFVLKRQLSPLQFVGAGLIVSSIIVAKLPDVMGSKSSANGIPLTAIILAIIASFNSVGAAVYTEMLFKSSGPTTGSTSDNFLNQQFWMYFYGIIVTTTLHLTVNINYTPIHFLSDVHGLNSNSFLLLITALFFGSFGGLVVANILKHLDNIVKEYSGSVANIITAILCSLLFPDKFQFTIYIFFSLIFLLTGIFLYETQKIKKTTVTADSAPLITNNLVIKK